MVEHLKELLQGRAVECPIYDFATHLRKENETIRVEPRPIILVEGILIFCDSELRDRMDLKVYVDVEADKRILRRIGRDLVQRGRTFDSIVSQYLETVKPMHDRYVEPSKQYADLIVPFGGKNVAAIQVLLERLKAHLRNNFAWQNHQTMTQEGSASDGEAPRVEAGFLPAPRSESTPVFQTRRTSEIELELPYVRRQDSSPEGGGFAL